MKNDDLRLLNEFRDRLYEMSAPSEPCPIIAQFRLMGYWGNEYPGHKFHHPGSDATDTIAAMMVANLGVELRVAYEVLASWPTPILQPVTNIKK